MRGGDVSQLLENSLQNLKDLEELLQKIEDPAKQEQLEANAHNFRIMNATLKRSTERTALKDEELASLVHAIENAKTKSNLSKRNKQNLQTKISEFEEEYSANLSQTNKHTLEEYVPFIKSLLQKQEEEPEEILPPKQTQLTREEEIRHAGPGAYALQRVQSPNRNPLFVSRNKRQTQKKQSNKPSPQILTRSVTTPSSLRRNRKSRKNRKNLKTRR
jgi:hypothetical protein